MPSKRRGGFGPPELRGTLGTLLRTTTGVVRDALERGAREGRARLDDARASRLRADTLADLGELVLDLIRRGEIDLAELPEARDLVRQLDELDAEPIESPPPPPRSSSRRRYDDRSRDDRPRDDRSRDSSSPRATSPREDRSHDVRSRDAHSRDDRSRDPGARDDRPRLGRPASIASAADTADDGTVSSGLADRTMRPTLPARPKHPDSASSRANTKPMKGLYRSRLTDDDPSSSPPAPPRPPAATRGAAALATAEPSTPRRSPLPLDPNRKGGISFDDDDDDLVDYMHPDDVPPK